MNLHFREYGQGSPVVILHGLFGFSDNWQTIAKGLSDHHTVVTVDLRNHGRSPHIPTHSYPEMAEDVRAFMESRWMFNAALIGHSMGGKVAMQLALSHPDAVNRLVVIDMDPGQATDNHRDIFTALRELDFSKVTSRQAAEEFLKNRIPEASTRQFLLKNITRHDDGSLTWKMNLSVLWERYADILAAVTGPPFEKPALFVRGGKSNYIKESDFALIRELFPQADIRTIAEAGHWVHADQPQELLALLKKFLDD